MKASWISILQIPTPVREPLNKGQAYYIPDFVDEDGTLFFWNGDDVDMYHLTSGLIHLTKEGAKKHADALRLITCIEE